MKTLFKHKALLFLFALVFVNSADVFAAGKGSTPVQTTGFTKADRDRLIRMEAILEQHEKRFEDMNKRSEELRFDINARFDGLYTLLWILSGIFTVMVGATIGFAFWDRRTMIRPFETKVKEINIAIDQLTQEKTANKILTALRELAKTDVKVAEALRTHNLL